MNILSSNILLSNQQNLVKLFIADTIGNTSIQTVEFRIVEKDGRNTSTEIIGWTEMNQSDTFYSYSFTPTFTKNTQLLLQVKVTDYDDDNYLLSSNLTGEV